MSALVVKQPTIVGDGRLRISTALVSDGGWRTLWFELGAEHASAVSTQALDAFMVSALVPAMMQGRDLQVEGAVSSKLFYNLPIPTSLCCVACSPISRPSASWPKS